MTSGDLLGCLIVSGMPGAGKSTVTALAARLLPRAAQVTGMEVCQHRNATRDPDERFEFHGYHRLDADMRQQLGHLGWWLDTSALTPAETAERLVRDAAHRAPLM